MSSTQQKLFPGSPVKPTIEHLDDSGSDEADCPGLSNIIHVENFLTMSEAFAKSPQDGSPDGLRRLRRHRASGCLRESYNLQSSCRWIFPIFEKKRHGSKLIHIPVGVRESDESLFLALNRHYSQSTNKLVRYLSLRGVFKIHYVKVGLRIITLIFQRLNIYADCSLCLHTVDLTSRRLTIGLLSAIAHHGHTRGVQLRRKTCRLLGSLF